MDTQVPVEHHHHQGSGLWVFLSILLIGGMFFLAFYYFGFPGIQSSQINIPNKFDVNINQNPSQ